MKLKHIILLAVIFLALLGIVYAKKVLVKPQIETAEYKKIEIAFDPVDIYALEIKRGGKALKLEKKGDNWHIPLRWNMRAKKQQIEAFLNELKALQGELRSTSQKLLSDYGISDEEGIALILSDKDGKVRQHLFLGVKKPGYESGFLRKSGSNDVYLINKDIFSQLYIYENPKDADINKDVYLDQWVDYAVIKFDIDKVEAINITRLGAKEKIVTVDIKKELDENNNLKQWVAVGSSSLFELDAKKIKDYLNRVNNLYASKAVDPLGKDYGLDNPYLKVSLSGEKPLELILGGTTQKDNQDRYLKTSEGYFYTLANYNIKNLDITMSQFFVDNPLRINKDTLESITIKSEGKTVVLSKDLIGKNNGYIDKLRKFSIEKMLLEDKYRGFKVTPKYSAQLKQTDGTRLTIEAEKSKDGVYLAQLRGKPGLFSLSKDIFESTFLGLDKLNLSAETKKK